MRERMYVCPDKGTRPECRTCTEIERPMPANWPEGMSSPCIVDAERVVREGEEELSRRLKEYYRNVRRATGNENPGDIVITI